MKKKLNEKEHDEKKMQSELQHQLVVARKKAMRATREKQIQIISMLPPSAVQKYLEESREQAAVKIQSTWRGHQVRKTVSDRKITNSRNKAAIVIQRGVSVIEELKT